MIRDATSTTAAVRKGTTASATVIRSRVLVFEAGVDATAVRIRAKSSSGGGTSDPNRDGVPRFVIVVLFPSRGAQRGPELNVRSMGALPHHSGRRSEHRGCLLHAESFLLEEDVRHPVLLRHAAQLARKHLLHIACSDRCLRRVAVVGMQPLLLGRVVRRTEILGTAPPIPQSIEVDRS